MKNFGLNITRDELIAKARELNITVVPCTRNHHRLTLLDRGERIESFTENGSDTQIMWHAGAKVHGTDFAHMPWIVERLLNALNLLEETV